MAEPRQSFLRRLKVSEEFFNRIITDVIFLVNEEFEKLRLKKIIRDDVELFFLDDVIGIQINLDIKESKKRILNQRLVKISMEIQELHSIPGFRVVC